MKVKVLKTFRDKETKAIHKAGTEIDVSATRFKEINSTKAGELVEKVKEKAAEKKGD